MPIKSGYYRQDLDRGKVIKNRREER